MASRTSLGGAAGGTTATAAPVFDARDYGTVDTTGTASSRAAIQAAIAACQTAGGGTVLLPAGTLKLDNSLQITASGVRLVGQGYATLLTTAVSLGNKHIISAQGSSGTPIHGVTIAQLRVQSHGDDAGATSDKHGIYARWCDNLHVTDVWAHDCPFAALKIDDSEHAVVTNFTVVAGTRGNTGGWYGIELANYTKGQGARGYSGHHVLTGITTHVPEHSIAVYLCDDVVISGVAASGGQNDYTFNWTAAVRVVMSDFTIVSNGGGYIYLEHDQTLGTSRGCQYIKFENGACTGLITAAAVQVRDLDGIYLVNSPDTVIENVLLDCSAQTGTTHGIEVASTSPRLRLADITILSPIKDGVKINADNCSLYRVRVSSPRGGGSTNAGINIAAGIQALVQGCRIESGSGNGIYAASQYGLILDNYVTGCALNGIDLASSDMTAARNHSTGHTGVGIKVESGSSRPRIIGNFCQTNTGGNYTISGSVPTITRDNKGLTNDLQARSSTFTLTQTDFVNVVDASSAARTVTLPAANATPNGKTYVVKNKAGSANNVTVAAAGSDTIDGSANITLTAGQVAWLICDGTSLWNAI